MNSPWVSPVSPLLTHLPFEFFTVSSDIFSLLNVISGNPVSLINSQALASSTKLPATYGDYRAMKMAQERSSTLFLLFAAIPYLITGIVFTILAVI